MTENTPPMPVAETIQSNRHLCLEFDPNDYRHHLEDHDLTPAQEEELLRSLWIIIRIFIDMGFGGDPIQLILDEWKKGGVNGHKDTKH